MDLSKNIVRNECYLWESWQEEQIRNKLGHQITLSSCNPTLENGWRHTEWGGTCCCLCPMVKQSTLVSKAA